MSNNPYTLAVHNQVVGTGNFSSSPTAPSSPSFNPNLGTSMLPYNGGNPPTDGRIAALEVKVDSLDANLKRIEENQTWHFKAGLGAIGLIFTAIIGSYILLDNKFPDVNSRFQRVEERIAKLETTVGRMDERVKNIEKHVEKIPTRDEMKGILHEVIDSKKE